MTVNRRGILAAGMGMGGLGGLSLVERASAAGARQRLPAAGLESDGNKATVMSSRDVGLAPDSSDDQSTVLQDAIDRASEHRVTLVLAPGRYRASGLMLRSNTMITVPGGHAALVLAKGSPLLIAENAKSVALRGLSIEGGMQVPGGAHNALVSLKSCRDVMMENMAISESGGRGVALESCSGSILRSRVSVVKDAGIFALDSTGLDILDNHVSECGNNGIQVWRTKPGEDGTLVCRNRVEHISAWSGGSGQNGNGINVFRAGSVIVDGNRITDCAYSAVRGNAASNLQILGNSCERLGEVALYAEFGFEGAIISGNLVDGAAAGISVTNFNEGGRLAVIQGNLIRNLRRREHEPVDKRGEGIGVEADASVTGNVIEGAPTAGVVIGWGPYMRNVAATGNVIRDAGVGVMISAHAQAGSCIFSNNMMSLCRNGAVRLMDEGVVSGPDLARNAAGSGVTGNRIIVSGNAVS
ncbi:MAG: TIGR03808 family TAT-translocated repetitive protein [Hyphomicrobiaceae bacterium]|nr:TIGR03808 family TAT-translocated repetitive protein [Hyphomicrobiaceae bacterium]